MAPGLQNDPGTLQQEAGAGWDQFIFSGTRDLSLTATGTNQNGALQLNKMVNYVTSVGVGSGVILPPMRASLIGAEICVINAGSNPLQVYGAPGFGSSDSINGMGGAGGVTMMPNSIAYFIGLAAGGFAGASSGAWLATGLGFGFATGNSASFETLSTQTGITASTTQTAAAGTLITGAQAQIATCATIGNAVTLPPAKPGMQITIVNNGAAAAGVFGATQTQGGQSGGDTIAGSLTAFSLAVTTPVIFYCFVAGNWVTK